MCCGNRFIFKLFPLDFRNIGVLSENYTVYALDLLGFGASEKPPGFSYTMEGWAQVPYRLVYPFSSDQYHASLDAYSIRTNMFRKQLILDFLNDIVQKPTVLVGNSVGSLACVIAASG